MKKQNCKNWEGIELGCSAWGGYGERRSLLPHSRESKKRRSPRDRSDEQKKRRREWLSLSSHLQRINYVRIDGKRQMWVVERWGLQESGSVPGSGQLLKEGAT